LRKGTTLVVPLDDTPSASYGLQALWKGTTLVVPLRRTQSPFAGFSRCATEQGLKAKRREFFPHFPARINPCPLAKPGLKTAADEFALHLTARIPPQG